MEFKDDKLLLNVNKNVFNFQGKLEKSDYSGLSKFLEQAEAKIQENIMDFDFRNLEFLNSSGIRAIAVFFLSCNKKINIYINKAVTWQRVGLIPLKSMKEDDMITVIE